MKKFLVAAVVTVATCSMVFWAGPRAASADMVLSHPVDGQSEEVRGERNAAVVRELLGQSGMSKAEAVSCIKALSSQELEMLAAAPAMLQDAGAPPVALVTTILLVFAALMYLFWIESNTEDDAAGPPERSPAK